MQQTYDAQVHAFNETAIELHNFGLADVDMSNPHAMRQQRLNEGEEKFYLRQMIYAFKFLKYREKIPLQESDFHKVRNLLVTSVPFYTKKSPLGMLVAYYLYNPKTFMHRDKFNKLMHTTMPVTPTTVLPFNYSMRVYAGDVVRYVKLLHTLL